jgi:hypothetical protein
MKHVLLFLFSIVTLVSCQFTTGSGNIISENRTVSNFDAISVGGSYDVEVEIGPVTSVRVEADDNIIKYVEAIVSGNTLKINTRSNHSFSNVHLKVFITTPALKDVKASSSADVVVLGVIENSGKISFRASSSASIRAEVNAPEIESDASSSATIALSGKTKSYDAQASSSADIKSFNLLSETASAKASSSATIELFASVSLDGRASSSGDIRYKGAATVNKSTSSSGSVEKKD